MAVRGTRRGKRDQLDGEVVRSSDRLEDIFWNVLPTFLAIGMSADEFWHGEPRLARSYSDAWKVSKQAQYHAEWRAGIYVAKAISACLSNAAEYPSEPLFTTETAEEVLERQQRAAMLRMKERFESQVAAARKKMSESGSESHGS